MFNGSYIVKVRVHDNHITWSAIHIYIWMLQLIVSKSVDKLTSANTLDIYKITLHNSPITFLYTIEKYSIDANYSEAILQYPNYH